MGLPVEKRDALEVGRSGFTTITAGDSSGNSDNKASVSAVNEDNGSVLYRNVSNTRVNEIERTYFILANIFPMEHALTQSTVHKVLSSSSSEGSGGSSAA